MKSFDFAAVPGVDPAAHAGAGRNTQFALAACADAWRMSGLGSPPTSTPTGAGIYLAGGEGELDFRAFTAAALSVLGPGGTAVGRHGEVGRRRRPSGWSGVRELEQEPNMPLSHLALLTGARGPALNCLTACAASTQAIGEATAILRRGDADVMIGGGTHSMIHPFGVTGFNRLTALAEDGQAAGHPRHRRPGPRQPPVRQQPRPGSSSARGPASSSSKRCSTPQARGATILAEVAGYGSTADAYRITDQAPDGSGAIGAMRAALADAKMQPADVGYINAHGTGTKENDGNETNGHPIRCSAPVGTACPVSSIKSMMGHLIAAAGAVELIACVLALRDGMLPPTMNLTAPDPDCDLDYVPNAARAAGRRRRAEQQLRLRRAERLDHRPPVPGGVSAAGGTGPYTAGSNRLRWCAPRYRRCSSWSEKG